MPAVPPMARVGTSAPRLARVGRVDLGFSIGIILVVGAASRQNKVLLHPSHLDGALIVIVVEQVAWSSHRSSDLAILVSQLCR